MANEVSVIIRAKDFASKVFKGAETNIRSFVRLSKDVAKDLTALAAGATAALLGVTKLAQRGGDYTGVQLAFNRITGDGAAALAELKAATGGVISNFDLMQRYNVAVSRGSVKNVQEFGQLARISSTLGDVIGDDAAAFDMLSEAVSKGNAKAASGLGIMVDQKEAHEAYAKSLGKEVKELTELEKKRAVGNAILAEGGRIAKDIAGDMPDAAEAADRLATTISNVKDGLAKLVAMSPAVAGFFTNLENWLFMASGGDLTARADIAQLAGITDPKALKASRRTRFSEAQVSAANVIRMRADLETNPLSARERREVGLSGSTARVAALDAEVKKLEGLSQSIDFIEAKLRPLSAPTTDGGGGGGSAEIDKAAEKRREAIEDMRLEAERTKELAAAWMQGDAVLDGINQKYDYRIAMLKAARDYTGQERAEVEKLIAAQFGLDPASQALLANLPGLSSRATPSLANAGGPPPDIIPRASGSKEFGERMKELLGQTDQSVGASMERIAKGEKERGDAALEAAKQMDEARGLVVSSLGSMAQAAIEGSEITARSITSMLGNIISSIPGVGGFAGSLIRTGLGIVGGLFGRHHDDKPVKVKVDDISDAAARKMAEKASGPQHVTVIIEGADGSRRQVEYTEAQLLRRQKLNGVVRLPRGVSL